MYRRPKAIVTDMHTLLSELRLSYFIHQSSLDVLWPYCTVAL